MEIQLGKKKIGCAPGLTSLFLIAIGVVLLGASYLLLGPAASEARDFVRALRHDDMEASAEYIDPSLTARLHRAFLEHRMDEPIASLAVGDGFHDWHVSARKGERCFRFTGQRDRVIYVTLMEEEGAWKVTQVSFLEGATPVCTAN